MKISKQVLRKSIIAYLIVFIVSFIMMKYHSGGGKGRLEGHYEISWTELFSTIHYLAVIDLIICYPFFYVFHRDYKRSIENKSKDDK